MKMWDKEYIEEQILLLLDKELSAQEEEKVWQQINAHPEYKQLYDEYAMIYLDAPTDEQEIDFSYLKQKESTAFVPIKKQKPIWKPALGIAAGLAIMIGLGIINSNKNVLESTFEVVKSDNVNPMFQSPVQKLASDTANQKKTIHQQPKAAKPKQINETKNETKLAMVTPVIPEQQVRNNIATLSQNEKEVTIAKLSVPKLRNKFENTSTNLSTSIALSKKDKTLDNESDAKGLLPEVIKAGQWIFGDRKESTTIEFAIGNKENRTFKIKL